MISSVNWRQKERKSDREEKGAGARTQDSAGGINTGWFEGYDYIYEKEFDIPGEWAGRYAGFEFEGIYHNAEIYLNGEKAAFRPYGYSDFFVDASKYLKYGEKNQIRVIAHNADQPNSRWYSGAGIYRPVWMYTAPEGHILQNGIRVKTISISPAVIEAEIRTSCPGMLDLRIIPGKEGQETRKDGNEERSAREIVAGVREHTDGTVTVRMTVPEARLWTVDTPDLYRLQAEFTADTPEHVAET